MQNRTSTRAELGDALTHLAGAIDQAREAGVDADAIVSTVDGVIDEIAWATISLATLSGGGR